MTFFEQIIWDLENDPNGNVQHLARHHVTPDEAEEVLIDPRSVTTISKSSGEQITYDYTGAGRYLAVAWQMVSDDPLIARPITAFDPNRGE
jgi:YD repeat-containing protein